MFNDDSGDGTPARAVRPQSPRKAPTIQDVARYANVAVGTVSRVINNAHGVKQATRQRVLAAIRELDYTPDPIARSMTSRRTGSIGVVVPNFTRPFFNEMLEAVEMTITQAGYELTLYNVRNRRQSEAYFRLLSKQRRVDGVLIISINPDDVAVEGFKGFGLPAVIIDGYHPQLSSFVVDNTEGGERAGRYLLSCGHRRIGFIGGYDEEQLLDKTVERLQGLRKALREAHVPLDLLSMQTSAWDRQGGKKAAMLLLQQPTRPTAILAASDMQAIGVLEAARTLHLEIPEDLSLIGYDGIELAEILGLSTVKQPIREMGRRGVLKLLDNMENVGLYGTDAELILLKPELIIRNTSTNL